MSFLENTVDQGRAAIRSVGHLDLQEHVGQGQFGDVWRAWDSELDRTVAVKIPRAKELDDETLKLFLREARAAAQLRHPNIVTIHEIGREEDTVYIVSDFIQGITLSELIAQNRPGQRDAAALCITLADAIHHAHEAGVVHRDLKPRNILIDTQGQPYITDFGLAKRDSGEITVAASGRILGTPAYMSPEQARGHGHKADRRSDVYSLGVILYELLTGQRPFQGESRLLVHQVLSEEPRRPSKLDKLIPRDLECICLKAMSKEPKRRYQTAEDFANDLRQFHQGRPIVARPVGPIERAWRSARRNPAITALSTIALIAVLLAILFRVQRAPISAVTVETRTVRVTTKPPGAEVSFIPRDDTTGEPVPERIVRGIGTSPVEVEVPAGLYLVVAALPDGRFHEVFRTVPKRNSGVAGIFRYNKWTDDGSTVVLPEIDIPPLTITDEMVLIHGDREFSVGSPDIPSLPVHVRFIPSFYLDANEVTLAEYRDAVGSFPFGARQNASQSNEPVRLSYDYSVAYAEKIGKRLPDEFEYEFAATFGGTRPFPWGNSNETATEWTFGPSGEPAFDQLPTDPPAVGLFSNVAEWTSSWCNPYPSASFVPESLDASRDRVVRGGSPSVIRGEPDGTDWLAGPRIRTAANPHIDYRGVGVRCVRSAHPRLTAADFVRIVETSDSKDAH